MPPPYVVLSVPLKEGKAGIRCLPAEYCSVFPGADGNLKSWAQAGQGCRISTSPALGPRLCSTKFPFFSFLVRWQGGVILVSHDERFIRLVCQELWVCENATVTRIEGGFDQYRDILKEQFRKEGFL